ncbi:hypothetical protein D3C87_1417930 [compost metagenome]
MFSKVILDVLSDTGIVLLATFFPFGFLRITVKDKSLAFSVFTVEVRICKEAFLAETSGVVIFKLSI